MRGESPEIAIVGAGIAGLTAAIALEREGFRTRVFEQSPVLRAGGGALILWCNALKALDRVGLRRVLCEAPTAQEVETSEFRNHAGDFLTSIPVGDLGRHHDAETIVVSRRDLLETLLANVPRTSEVVFDVRLRAIDQDADSVVATFSDGSVRRFSALIGADGINSTVRGLLGIDAGLRHTNQDLWVGTTRSPHDDLIPGHNVATVGAGYRFWHTLLGDGRVFWYAAVPTAGRHVPPAKVSDLAKLFARWHEPIPAILRATEDDDVVRSPMRDRAPTLPWGSGRVTLMGDAAHSMTPDIGQGACQAMESAVVLASRLRGASDLPRALRSYERDRFGRTADINRMSWLVAHSSSVAEPTLCSLRDAAMRIGLRAAVMSQLDWLFAGP